MGMRQAFWLVCVALSVVPFSNAGAGTADGEQLASSQYGWLVHDMRGHHSFAKSEILHLFRLTGAGSVVSYNGSQKEAFHPVYFTTYQYSARQLPGDTWLKRVDLTIVDGTEDVIGVKMYARSDVCIDTIKFAHRFGLKEAWRADPGSGIVYR